MMERLDWDSARDRTSANPSPADEAATRPRARFVLEDRGFDEVPRRYRRFYREWNGAGDKLAPNEALCPVCKVVIRSGREFPPRRPRLLHAVLVATDRGEGSRRPPRNLGRQLSN